MKIGPNIAKDNSHPVINAMMIPLILIDRIIRINPNFYPIASLNKLQSTLKLEMIISL